MARTLLALLAMRVNQPVTAEWIIEGLWPRTPPKSALANIRSHLANLRSLLTPAEDDPADDPECRVEITATDDGYLLRAPTDAVDSTHFRRLLADGKRYRLAGAHRTAAETLTAGVALWRGPLMAGVPVPDLLTAEAAALEDQRVTALEELADARLALGQHDELVPMLRGLVLEHPFRERLWHQLMAALHRSGRTGEAVETYRRLRRVLRDELGSEPSTESTTLLRSISGREPAAAAPAPTTPRQLPPDVGHLVGREPVLADLDAMLARGDKTVAAPLGVITGIAGVGKTALAVRWGHSRSARFPDGQLYCDLRGSTPAAALPPSTVISGFLRAFGMPASQVPADQDEASGLLRSVLADRKVLLLLDNAASAEQIRALRPAAPGCVVLVTSRHRLSGLIAHDDARRIELATLTSADSTKLLTNIVGAARTDTEPAAAADIATLCGRLPLALRIAATRLCDDTGTTLAAFARRLSGGTRLTTLTLGDDQPAGVAAAFELSYLAMSEQARAVFWIIGLQPTAHTSPPLVAAMTELTAAEVRGALSELVEAHLLTRHGDRYRMHDLLTLYARDRASAEMTTEARERAVAAGLDWLLRTAFAAAELVQPHFLRLELPVGRAAATFGSVRDAAAWLRTEGDTIVDAIRFAGTDPAHQRYAWLLTDVMQGQFRTDLTLAQWRASVDTGLAAARRSGPDLAVAAMLRGQGNLLLKYGDRAAALTSYREALTLYARLNVPAGICVVRSNIGMALAEDLRLVEAEKEMRHALESAQLQGNPAVIGTILANLATLTDPDNLGWLEDSLDYATRAVDLARATPDADTYALFSRLMTRSESLRALADNDAASADTAEATAILADSAHLASRPAVLDRLANACRVEGRLDDALDYAGRALAAVRRRASPSEEAAVHNTLGRVLADLGHRQDADDRFTDALTTARGIGDVQAEIQALAGLAAGKPPGEAEPLYATAATLAKTHELAVATATIHLALATLTLAHDDRPAATRHATEAQTASQRSGFRHGLIESARLAATAATPPPANTR